jgi:hypothetical protein
MEENKSKNVDVRTYAEDMARTLESGEGGMIKKIIQEQERVEEQKKELSPESKKNKIFMITSAVLAVLALFTLVLVITFRQKIFTVSVAPQFKPIIFIDQSKPLEIGGLNKDKIAQTVLNEVKTAKIKSGGVEGIYLMNNKRPVLLREFISLIKSSFIPGETVFVSDNYLLGVFNKETVADGGASKSLFFLLKVRSLADVFQSMRDWENKIFYDLHGFWGIDITTDTNYLLTKDFEDGIVENKNARILRDNDGKIVLMYIFADENSIIITNTPQAVHEIILRLASSKIKK